MSCGRWTYIATVRVGLCLLALGACATASRALAQQEQTNRPQEGLQLEVPLPELPEAPVRSVPEPTAQQSERLSDLLARITNKEALIRQSAIRELLEVSHELTPAILRKLHQVGDRGVQSGMKRVLTRIREEARQAEQKAMRARGERGEVKTPDYLEMLHTFAEPENEAWRDNMTVLALSRMLVRIGTIEAARALIDVYVRFGDFLRVDTQLQLAAIGDVAVAAFIEAQRHQSAKIGSWAKRQLDLMRRALPSDAVRGASDGALPDILRAYGYIKDPDAMRIIVSFTNSERAQIRLAARQAVRLLGPSALWQLRDSYQDMAMRTAPRDWPWDRVARELFREFDRLRLMRTHSLFNEGVDLMNQGKLAEMKARFDQVLTRNPEFDERAGLAEGYLKFAEANAEKDPDASLDAASRAERLTYEDKLQPVARSLRLSLEARALAQSGVLDRSLLERALELNADNPVALKLRDEFFSQGDSGRSSRARYAGAIAIALSAVMATLAVLIRRPGAITPEGASPSSDTAVQTANTSGSIASEDSDKDQ